ncbi:MAG TPA: LysM domain-containing protein [Solirubrobacteraceae bacterium]|jgi:LysM repeat protein|nr:LysM domain-containing protein [Solirubrobacteraceae bacterium]
MYEQSRPRRNPLRYLAPVALVAIVLATYLVVQHNGGTSSGGSGSTSVTTSSHTSTSSTTSTSGKNQTSAKSKYYKVRSGDSLSVISARTGVSLPTLESLNPGVSSSNLQVGQRLKLRR